MSHNHYAFDSISVCEECNITLRAVNALQRAGLHTWAEALDKYDDGRLIDIKGVGSLTVSALLQVPVSSI